MTRKATKKIEQYYAENAARLLEEEWQLTPNEAPDFIVSKGGYEFGLEVTQVHIGEKTRSGGSRDRAAERSNHQWLMSIREEFSKVSKSELSLRYLGSATKRARAAILAALVAEQFDTRPAFHRLNLSFDGGKIWVFKSPNPAWLFLRDRVGWVSQDGDYLIEAIAAKVSKLPMYRRACDDVRLLVVADRTANSGKLTLEDDFKPDLRGFNLAYFFSYPITVRTFSSG